MFRRICLFSTNGSDLVDSLLDARIDAGVPKPQLVCGRGARAQIHHCLHQPAQSGQASLHPFQDLGLFGIQGPHLTSQEKAAVALNGHERHADVVNRASEKIASILIMLAELQIRLQQLAEDPVAIQLQTR